MSRRLTAFRVANIAPQPACNYLVYIPPIITSPLAVETATLPFPEIETKTIPLRGISYTIPVKRKAQGAWTCTMNESILLTSVYQSLYKMYNDYQKMRSGEDLSLESINPMSTDDLMDIFSAKMKDVFIFMTDGVTGAIPMLTCILKDCFLTKIDPINFSADGAATPVKVSLTLQFNDIVSGLDLKGVKNPLAITAINAAKLAAGYGTSKGLNYLLNQ